MDFREYIGFSPTSENITIKESVIRPIDQLSSSDGSDNELIVEIEAVHAYPYVTKNSTRYSYQGLEDSLSEWTHPYNIPIIMHHNDQDGQIIGRAIDARLGDSERLVGSKALFITAEILDEKAQKDIKSGLLSTVSIGMTGHDVRCSICGQDLANDGLCEHARGTKYDGEMCYWDFKKLEPKELSYVIVPSDAYAKNIKVYDDNAEPAQVEPVLPISSLEGEHDGNKIVVKEHMEKEPKVIPAEVEAKESAEVTPAPAEETETPAKVEEPTEVKESEDTKFEELSAKVQELIEAKEQVEKDYKNLASDFLAYKNEVREQLQAVVSSKEELQEAIDSVKTVKEGLETLRSESEKALQDNVTAVKESLEEKIKTIELSTSKVEDPVKKTEVKPVVEVTESLSDLYKYFK